MLLKIPKLKGNQINDLELTILVTSVSRLSIFSRISKVASQLTNIPPISTF